MDIAQYEQLKPSVAGESLGPAYRRCARYKFEVQQKPQRATKPKQLTTSCVEWA